MSFWKQYHSLCESIGKSPNAVADELEFSNATCTKWKNGATPQGKSLAKIAEYFDVSIDTLLGKEKNVPADFHKNEADIKDKIFGLFDNDGYRQDDLADYLGVPEQVIRDWESGQNKDYMKHLEEIAKYFDVNIEYFYEEEKNKPLAVEQSDLYNYLLKTYSSDELAEISSLSRDEAKQVVDFVHDLLSKR